MNVRQPFGISLAECISRLQKICRNSKMLTRNVRCVWCWCLFFLSISGRYRIWCNSLSIVGERQPIEHKETPIPHACKQKWPNWLLPFGWRPLRYFLRYCNSFWILFSVFNETSQQLSLITATSTSSEAHLLPLALHSEDCHLWGTCLQQV